VSLLDGPVLGEHGAVLDDGDVVATLHVRVDKVALAARSIIGLLASGDAPLSIEFAVLPVPHAHVGVLTVAVKRGFDGSTECVRLKGIAGRDIGRDNVLDVGIGAGHDDVEILTGLALVDGDVGEDGA